VTPPRLLLILTENWTMRPTPDVADLVRFAVEAERAGIDGVMVSEHIVLGPSAGEAGLPANPRDYALPGNQDPATPWPSPLVLLSAVAAATSRIRLVAGALISPLRHPLATAKDLATLDRLSGGRLIVQPTVSWHRDEYAALGVPFGQRGEILDEQLEVWAKAWAGSPVSHVADLDRALAGIPAQMARGFTTICVKPSQFIDSTAQIGAFCRDLVARVAAFGGS
jgi:alkanesulfonate monooxygenase SsuD/methylene tetrahydromethanopterin reductase-like flavin-dependent oxidoreductase (luciferase family)